MRQLAIALGLFCASFGAVHSQVPDPNDCTVAGYISRFDDARAPRVFSCRIVHRASHELGGPGRYVRVIDNSNAERPTNSTVIIGVQNGVNAALAMLGRLENVRLPNVTILAHDGEATGIPSGREVLARTLGSFGRPECNITFYNLASNRGQGDVAATTAHEIFHCMQYETLSAAQMNTYSSGGTWWVEGVAEALTDFALPLVGGSLDRSDDFEQALRMSKALNEMEHEATPFFQWLIGGRGAQAAITFQSRMAGRSAPAAQHAAMRAAMSDADWATFAKDYADNRIAMASGAPMDTPAPDDLQFNFSETNSWPLTSAPFVLNLGRAGYECGQWSNDAGSVGFAAVKRDEVWQNWPRQVDGSVGSEASLQFVALNTGSAGDTHRLTVTLETPCGACGETEAIDACLVGNWVMTDGGPIEWMRANGMPATVQVEASQMAVQMRRNGGYTTAPMSATVTAENDGVSIEGLGDALPNLGKWSAEAGVLSICPNPGGGVDARVSIDGAPAMNFFNPPSDIQMDYTCEGATMVTRMHVAPSLPPIESIFTRQ